MPGQGAIGEFVRLGAGLESLVVPAAGKRPIPLELVAPGVGGEGSFDFRPRHVPVPIHVPLGDGIGDSLKAEHPHQPIEDRRGVMVFDCSNEASVDCINLKVVDAGNLASNVADPANNRLGVPHSLGSTSDWANRVGTLDQRHQPALGVGVAVDVGLGRLN